MATPIPTNPPLSDATSVNRQLGREVDRADSGAVYIRQIYSSTMYEINAVWDVLTKAERLIIGEFLENYGGQEMSMEIDGDLYHAKLTSDLPWSWRSSNLSKMSATFIGYRIDA